MEWFVDHVQLLSTTDGLVELLMAGLVFVGVRRRVGRVGPLALLVGAFFITEAGISFTRAAIGDGGGRALGWIVVLELVGTFLIVLMVARASHIARAIAFTVNEARYRAAEYERARRDYTQVVRHRIANPLTVIKGAAHTLDAADLDDATRHALRQSIIDAAEQLEAISLEPTRRGAEERELDAIPRIADARGPDQA